MLLRIVSPTILLLTALSLSVGSSADPSQTDKQPQPVPPATGPAEKNNDGLPPGALLRLGTVRLRHDEAVFSVAFSPDGKLLATATRSGVVSLSDAATNKPLSELPAGTGTLVRFTPDSKYLFCAGGKRGLAVVDVAAAKVVRTFGAEVEMKGPKGVAGERGDHHLALSADGLWLAEARGMEVILWNLATGKGERRLVGHTAPVFAVAFSPDGKLLAAGDGTGKVQAGLPGKGDTTILLWRTDTGAEVLRLREAHHGWIRALAFAPDGKTLASSSPYDTCLWDIKTEARLARFDSGGRSISFSPDGTMLAAASGYGGMDRGFIPIWDAKTHKPLHTLRGHVRLVSCVAFSPDSKSLASGGPEGTVRVWDAVNGTEIVRHEGHQAPIRSVAFAPNGTLVATASGGDHTVRVWGTATGAQLARMEIACPSPNHFCPTAHGGTLFFAPDGKTVICDNQVFDVRGGPPIATYPGNVLAQSTDGKVLALMTGDRFLSTPAAVALWDVVKARELTRIELPFQRSDAAVTAATLSPDGAQLAVAAAGRDFGPDAKPAETLFLYDITSKKLIHKFRPSGGVPAFLSFSSDGEWLVTSGPWDQPAQLWHARSGRAGHQLKGQEEPRQWTEHRPSAISPDGCLVAVAAKGHGVVLYETATGKEVHRLQGHKQAVGALAFGPDGRTLLSADTGTAALLWDLAPVGKQAKPAPAELELLWKQLAGEDAAAAYRAQWRLVTASAGAVALLKQQLRTPEQPGLERIPQLLADLASETFKVREAASLALGKLGPLVEDDLRKALAAKPTLEVRKRLELLLAALQKVPLSPEQIQERRAIQVLEWLGTPGAVEVLETLARGAPQLPTVRAAEAALRRLAARAAPAVGKAPLAPGSKPAPAAKPADLAGGKAEVTALVFAGDGRTLAAADAAGVVRLWDPVAKKLRKDIQADPQAVFAAAFSPDGQFLATGGQDRCVRLWDASSGKPVRALKGHGEAVAAVAFFPGGKRLASGGFDQAIRLWDPETGAELGRFFGHQGPVMSLAVWPDGKRLASGDLVVGDITYNGKRIDYHWSDVTRLWDFAKGTQIGSLPAGGQGIALSPDGKTLVSAKFESEFFAYGFHSIRSRGTVVVGDHGKPVVRGAADVYVVDVATGDTRLHLSGVGTAIALSADGRFLATARGTDLHLGGEVFGTPAEPKGDARLRVWELASGQEVLMFPAGVLPTVVAFAADGRTLAAGLKDGTVQLWDLAPGGEAPAKDLDQMWQSLISEDAGAAYRAAWALRASGPKTVVYLETRLLPSAANDPELLRLIADLGDERFQVREAAARELARRGADAEAALCLGLQKASSPAVRQRLLALLEAPGIGQHTDALGRSRAVAVLEAIGSDQARKLLGRLAEGSPLSRQTQEAKAALERLR
jgi:WD40 repeat protein